MAMPGPVAERASSPHAPPSRDQTPPGANYNIAESLRSLIRVFPGHHTSETIPQPFEQASGKMRRVVDEVVEFGFEPLGLGSLLRQLFFHAQRPQRSFLDCPFERLHLLLQRNCPGRAVLDLRLKA